MTELNKNTDNISDISVIKTKDLKLGRTKNIRNTRKSIDLNKLYNLDDALGVLKTSSFVKFDETVDVAIKLSVDKNDVIRGTASMPSGIGKTVKVAVICKDPKKIEEANSAGADCAGSDDIIDQIKSGKILYDSYIATPDMMSSLAKVARILGPRGLMPNPKLGTVTLDVKNAIKIVKSGRVEFRLDKGATIHAGIGKLSFQADSIRSNIQSLLDALYKLKPQSSKNNYINKLYISTTMGVALKVSLDGFKLL